METERHSEAAQNSSVNGGQWFVAEEGSLSHCS